jgi:hypothetical protein
MSRNPTTLKIENSNNTPEGACLTTEHERGVTVEEHAAAACRPVVLVNTDHTKSQCAAIKVTL